MRQMMWIGTVAALAASTVAVVWNSTRVQRAYDDKLAHLESAVAVTYAAALERQTVEERVIDLPEDGNQWHTILIVCPNWKSRPAERRAEAMFHAEPLLASLKHQTHWHLITTDQPEFGKFRALVEATPCLIVERANGEVVYRESGPELGRHAHGLTRAIRREIERHCPDGRCLPLHPVPGEDEKPSREEIPAVLREDGLSDKKRPSPIPLAAISALGGFLGLATKFKRAAGV